MRMARGLSTIGWSQRSRDSTPSAWWTARNSSGRKQNTLKAESKVLLVWHVADVKEWCRSCELCAQRKMPNPKLRAPEVNVQAGYPMHLVATNNQRPLQESSFGISPIFVTADYFTC